MAFKNDLSLSFFGKISLNEQWSEAKNVRNVSYTFVRCSRFFRRLALFLQFQEFSSQLSEFISDRAETLGLT